MFLVVAINILSVVYSCIPNTVQFNLYTRYFSRISLRFVFVHSDKGKFEHTWNIYKMRKGMYCILFEGKNCTLISTRICFRGKLQHSQTPASCSTCCSFTHYSLEWLFKLKRVIKYHREGNPNINLLILPECGRNLSGSLVKFLTTLETVINDIEVSKYLNFLSFIPDSQ